MLTLEEKVERNYTWEELNFITGFNNYAKIAMQQAKDKGFHHDPVHDGVRIALIHSELSEALESMRHGSPPDSHLPEYPGTVVELADAVIRIMDLAELRGMPVAQAIVDKMRYNANRPHKHGGKQF